MTGAHGGGGPHDAHDCAGDGVVVPVAPAAQPRAVRLFNSGVDLCLVS